MTRIVSNCSLAIILSAMASLWSNVCYASSTALSDSFEDATLYEDELKILGPDALQAVLSIFKKVEAARPVEPVNICSGRLTLTTGTPVVTSAVTGATNVYYTAFRGSKITLYDGTNWKLYSFGTGTPPEISVVVPSTTVTLFDIFAYDNTGTVTLETANWTNDTTRATDLAYQNGILVKSGTATRRYLGTGRTTGTSGQTETSFSGTGPTKWFLANHCNPQPVRLFVKDTTASWTYTTATWRSARASDSNRVEFLVPGLSAETQVKAHAEVITINASSSGAYVGVALNATNTTNSDLSLYGGASTIGRTASYYAGYPAIGYRFLQWTEYSNTGGTTTWYGEHASTFARAGMMVEFPN